MIPAAIERLCFREMVDADLDLMAGLPGDPEVMRHYPRARTRDEAWACVDLAVGPIGEAHVIAIINPVYGPRSVQTCC